MGPPKQSKAAIVYLVVLSLIMAAGVYYLLGVRAPVQPEKKAAAATLTPVSNYPPTAVNIPKIRKSLRVLPATVQGNNWDMFPDAVAWLSTSAVPGQGNVILYAHNWKTLWRDLYLLKPGDAINVQQNNEWKYYIVSASRDVDQHDVQAILSENNQLTLYTCEGTFDQKRRVVYADPVMPPTTQ